MNCRVGRAGGEAHRSATACAVGLAALDSTLRDFHWDGVRLCSWFLRAVFETKTKSDSPYCAPTPGTGSTRLCCATIAGATSLSLNCESMITKAGTYVCLAARFRYVAEMLLSSTTVEIDVNGDGYGYGKVPINLSSTNTLWA